MVEYFEDNSRHDSAVFHHEIITAEERIAVIRNPDLAQYLPKSERPVAPGDTDFFDIPDRIDPGLIAEHRRLLHEDFQQEAEWYDHTFLDERILNERAKIALRSATVKPISEAQASFDFVLGGSISMSIDSAAQVFTLKFKFVRNNNFSGLRLGHIDFLTPGYKHSYYNAMNDHLVELVAQKRIQKNDVLVSLLYQPKLDFRPFDFGMAILDIPNSQVLVKYGDQEFVQRVTV